MRDRTPTPACTPPPPCGLTLVELLVVLLIMSIMLAIAVPIVRPPVEARAVREGARMLSTALTSARTRAIQTGRPVGVMFEPSDAAGNTAAVLHYVQVAAPYAGTSIPSTIIFPNPPNIIVDPRDPLRQVAECTFDPVKDSVPDNEDDYIDTGVGDHFESGSQLQLGYKKPGYVVRENNGTTLTLEHPTIEWANSPEYWPVPDRYLSFQIFPPPKKSSLFPLQLPTRAVVDIGASGVGSSGQFSPGSGTPVMVTFTPTGEVDRIYHGDAPAGEELDEPLYLLVGKPGKTSYSENDTETNNLLDGENIWIKVDPRTGAVSSAEIRPMVEQVRIDMVNEDDDPNNDNVDPGIDPPDEPATPPEEQESNLPDIIRKSREFFDGS